MKLVIEICHASEYAENKWKQIQRIASAWEFADHLASPSFETTDGLLIRLRDKKSNKIHEIYASNNGEFVDIDAASACMSNSILAMNKNFARYWFEQEHPTLLIRTVERRLPKEAHLRLVTEYMRFLDGMEMSFADMPMIHPILDAQNFAFYENECRVMSSRNLTLRESNVLQAIRLYIEIHTHFDPNNNALGNFVHHACSALCGNSISNFVEVPEHTALIRKIFPFHEVIQWVTRN